VVRRVASAAGSLAGAASRAAGKPGLPALVHLFTCFTRGLLSAAVPVRWFSLAVAYIIPLYRVYKGNRSLTSRHKT